MKDKDKTKSKLIIDTNRRLQERREILLIEPDKEQSKLLTTWLEEEGCGVRSVNDPEQVSGSLSEGKADILIVDIDPPGKTEQLLAFSQNLKKDPHTQELPITVLTYKKDVKRITSAIEAGADSFIFKPFATDSFLERIKTIFKEIELRNEGKKVLDLNYINYLINVASEGGREDFFVLAPVIFNRLVMDKASTILGEPVIMVMIRRLQELVGEDYPFMKTVKLSGDRLLMNGLDKVSKDIPVAKLTTAFRDYIYAFLQLVQTLTSDILMERW